jgi:hypothetical protein
MTAYTFSQLIDFTRTTSATYVNASGLITTTPASVNLLTYTQDFDNAAWGSIGVTVTANAAVSPDGTSTADKVVATNTASTYRAIARGLTITATPYVYSVYAKAAEYSLLRFAEGASGRLYASFDLSNGTVVAGTTGGVQFTSASITAVGNGWYRCAVAFTGTAALYSLDFGGYPAGATLNPYGSQYAGDGISGVFAWGAQLELGSAPSTYTKNVGGLFPARFDYNPVTLAPRGLLIEEQRTNLAIYSEQFDNAAWLKNNATVTANSAVSPDGASTADLIVSAASTAITGANSSAVTFVAGSYTQSAYVKVATNIRYIQLLWTSGAVSADYANFDMQTGTVTAGTYASASMTDAGNGWYRIVMTSTVGAASGGMWPIAVPAAASARATSYVGNGTDSFRIWGAQLERGAFATSYIPTVASTVTRAADQAAIVSPMFAPWYNQSAGSFVVEYTQGFGTTARAVAVASDGTNNNVVELYIDGSNDAATLPFYGVSVAGAAQVAISFASAAQNATHKMGAAYQANDFAGSVDGATAITDTSGSLPIVNRLNIGSGGTAVTAFANGHLRSINYYPLRLTNAQLQGLTT